VALKVIKKEIILKYNMLKQLRREAEIQSHLKLIFFNLFIIIYNLKNVKIDIKILFNFMVISMTNQTYIL